MQLSNTVIPRVSILLPTYNGVDRITTAIRSVQTQSFQEWELIIVDDGSVQDVRAVLSTDPRIRYIRNEQNQGIQRSLNRGIAEAKGKYIARIDDDDIWSDVAKLSAQVGFLDTHPDFVLVGTGVIVVDEKGRELQRYFLPETDKSIRSKLLGKNCFIHSSVVFRNIGMRYSENEQVLHAEDYELWLRLSLEGKVTNLPTYSVRFTVRNQSLTGRNRVVQARRVLAIAWKYRGDYPHVCLGLGTALMRYIGFMILSLVPVPTKLFYWIQKLYKQI